MLLIIKQLFFIFGNQHHTVNRTPKFKFFLNFSPPLGNRLQLNFIRYLEKKFKLYQYSANNVPSAYKILMNTITPCIYIFYYV